MCSPWYSLETKINRLLGEENITARVSPLGEFCTPHTGKWDRRTEQSPEVVPGV